MSTPPRRRRRPDSPQSKGEGASWLPTIAIGLGVVIAGLALGALVAVLMQRNTGKPSPVAIVTSTPVRPVPPTRLPAPITLATLEPPHTPRPSPSPSLSPAETPSVEPTAEPSNQATARETVVPTSKPSPQPTPKTALEPAGKPSFEPGPRAASERSPRPARSAPVLAAATGAPEAARSAATETPAPLPSPPPAESTAAPAASSETQSGYDQRASAVVRRYLDALIRGDTKTAFAALGDNGGTLSEQAFLDPGARIVSVKVTRLDASNASVGCEIATAKGHYYATYHVTAANSGPYISEHDYIKV